MARISGVDLPREKRVEIGLTYIYGIGRSTAQNILRETGVNPDIRVKDLSESDVNKLREYIDHHCKVEGNDFCHRLVEHGRAVCTARTKPYCDKCCLADICRARKEFANE